jgi:hypothetical protein
MPFLNDCFDAGFKSTRDIPALEVDQCTDGAIKHTLLDPMTGAPIDLTTYGIGETGSNFSSSSAGEDFSGVKVVLKEMPEDATVWAETLADVEDAASGLVRIDYDSEFTRRAGIFTAEFQILESGDRRKIIPFFFIINPSLSGAPQHTNATLSIAEIRMTMRDTDPSGNYLIDELDFKQNEIALALRRAIDYWNEARPPVATGMKTTNFPWRYHLALAVVGQLHNWAAIHKMRNDLPYSAGGVTVQDTVKWLQYREIGDKMWGEWQIWVKEKKMEININGCFRTLNSGYQYGFFPR